MVGDGAELFKVTNLGLFKKHRMNEHCNCSCADTSSKLVLFLSIDSVLNEASREGTSSLASKREIVTCRWKFTLFLKFPRVATWEPQDSAVCLG